MKKIKNIVFDLDGTLIDSLPDIHASINHTLKRYNMPLVDMKFLGENVGFGVMRLIDNVTKQVLDVNTLKTEDIVNFKKKFIMDYMAYYEEYALTHGTLYEGVMAGIQNLFKKGYKMFIITNKPQNVTDAVINYIGIKEYFIDIIGDGKYPHRKPSLELWKTISEKYILKNDETIVFGDGTPDYEFAKNANTDICIALYGITPREKLIELQAEKYVDKFSDFVLYATSL